MIVVQDAAHCRTIIQHDLLGTDVGQAHIGRWRLAWDLGKRGQLRSMAFDSLGQKTKAPCFPNVYGPPIARSLSCIPPRYA